MSFPPTAHCYKAVRRHLPPQYDSVWISDALLAAAFARYTRPFRVRARHASSVPGPMEHRKRMAKRQMAELHFGQSHAAAPLWELANLVDLTQWKWKPPSLWNAITRQQYIEPLLELSPPSPLLALHTVLPGVAEPLPVRHSAGTVQEVLDTCTQLLSLDILNSTERNISNFVTFCKSWRSSLAQDEFRGHLICEFLPGLASRLRQPEMSVPWLSQGNAPLEHLFLHETIQGLKDLSRKISADFDHPIWNAVLLQISQVEGNTLRLFREALECIPQEQTVNVLPGILANLETFLAALQQSVSVSSRTRQARKMSRSLKPIGHDNIRLIMETVRDGLLQSTHLSESEFRNARYAFLQCLVRLPRIDIEYVAQSCLALEQGPHKTPLVGHEICVLFVKWAHFQAPLDYLQAITSRLKSHRRDTYRAISIALYRTHQFHRIKHLCIFLHLLGRESTIARLAKPLVRPLASSLGELALIALGMGKPWTAVEILIYLEATREHARRDVWKTDFGFAALESLIWTHNFDHKQLWPTLKLYSNPRDSRRPKGYRPRLTVEKIMQTAATGVVVGTSPYLSPERAFHIMTNCFRYLRAHEATLPPVFLRALVRNVTRHLADGDPGITSRLRFVLSIIKREVGPEEAERLALAIHRWRTMNLDRANTQQE
ncbi:hypothetical protein F5Y16DRAFT_393750 [Xylariaceae sp. FL0255]|nr:hypothetical protein F5Y16DRAFT_393750 [Xylariaceae sp. FL0255]